MHFIKVLEGNILDIVAIELLTCFLVFFLIAELTVTAVRYRKQKHVWVLLDFVDGYMLVLGDGVVFRRQHKDRCLNVWHEGVARDGSVKLVTSNVPIHRCSDCRVKLKERLTLVST